VSGALFAGLEVDGDMVGLARRFAERKGWRFLGVVQGSGLVATVPMAQLEDGHGELHLRTLEDLRAERAPVERAERRGPVDTRTLPLF